MQVLRTDSHGDRGLTYIPASGKYDGVVVWMHGLGDSADGWASIVPEMGLQNVKFILPSAHSIPITINGGHKMPGK
jgi:predicted esterase